jgi:hypothetical protein
MKGKFPVPFSVFGAGQVYTREFASIDVADGRKFHRFTGQLSPL